MTLKVKPELLFMLAVPLAIGIALSTTEAREPVPANRPKKETQKKAKPEEATPKVELKKHFPTKQLEKGEDVKWTHAPYNKGKCSLCHESDDIEKPGPMRASVNRICLSCHVKEKKKMKWKKMIHKPVAEDCGYCHNAHNSKYKSLLYRPMEELCVTCHTQQKKQISSKVDHEPVIRAKQCKHCHDSHASSNEQRLLMPQGKLCVDECHSNKKKTKDNRGKRLADIQALQSNRFRHGPFDEGECSECHNPHGSPHFRLLESSYPDEFYATYQDGTYAFCFRCHKKERVTAPKTDLTGFRKGTQNLHYTHVVKPEFGRSCRSCHEDHATESNHLMRKAVPYGTEGWELELNYVEKSDGGRCSKTCHDDEHYNNKGLRPKDVASEYKRKRAAEKKNPEN